MNSVNWWQFLAGLSTATFVVAVMNGWVILAAVNAGYMVVNIIFAVERVLEDRQGGKQDDI